MGIQFRRATETEDLEMIYNLYINAFPREERRSKQGFFMQPGMPGCSLDIIYQDAVYAGFCIWWQLEGFAFLEHLAVNPAMRGKKTGQKIMGKLRETVQGPLLLEIEPPTEGDALRRLHFYTRNGFFLLDKPYRQPSYHGGESLEMKLMCSTRQLPEDLIDHWIALIKKRVYNV